MSNALTTSQPIGQQYQLQTLSQGVLSFDVGAPASGVTSVFGRTGNVVAQNGDYTSTQVTNLSTLAGATVTAALSSLNIGNGQVAIGNGSGLTGLVGTVNGQALTWNVAGSTWLAGTDFGANQLTTTGSYRVNSGGVGFMQVGLDPGSGPGSAAALGSLRLRDGGAAYYHDDTLGADVRLYDVGANTINIGGPANLNLTCTASLSLSSTGAGVTITAGAVRIGKASLLFSTSVVNPDFGPEAKSTAGTAFDVHGQGSSGAVVAGPIEVHGGDNSNAGAGTHTGGKAIFRGGDNTSASGTPVGGDCQVRPGKGAGGQAGNLELMGTAGSFQGAKNCVVWDVVQTEPTGNPSANQLFVWVEANGHLTWRTPNGDIVRWTSTTAAAATAGGVALPLTCSEFLTLNYNGNVRKIALFAP